MDIIYWLLVAGVLIVLSLAGLIRPTGLLGRTRAEREQDDQRDSVANWLEKDGEPTEGLQTEGLQTEGLQTEGLQIEGLALRAGHKDPP